MGDLKLLELIYPQGIGYGTGNEPVVNFSCSFQVVFYHIVSNIFALCASDEGPFQIQYIVVHCSPYIII